MRDIALKVVPLDRTVDEEGQQLKDTKHIGACPYDTKLNSTIFCVRQSNIRVNTVLL